MAKYYNNRVKTGKLAGSVFAIRNGETIERAYQPIVANPSTPSQVASRAKLKLLSQMSAVVGPYVAIPRQGAISPRNLFTKKNYPLASFANNEASISLANIQLTSSVVGMVPITVSRANSTLNVTLENSNNDYDRVVYLVLQKNADNTLRVFHSDVVERESTGTFPYSRTASALLNLVIYAYGERDNSEAARAVFGNLQAPTAETIAKIITSRTLLENDVTLTETVGVESPAGE